MGKTVVRVPLLVGLPWQIPEGLLDYANIIGLPEHVAMRVEEDSGEVCEETNTFAYYPQKDAVINPNGEIYVESPLIVESRRRVVSRMEFHLGCHEALSFDCDTIVVLGPEATRSTRFQDLPQDAWVALRLLARTRLVIKPGRLHGLPFPYYHGRARGTVMLPEDTHKNNTFFVDFPQGFCLKPVLPSR
ncbi:MAG: hypothetical protein WCV92_01975 [Candidatus Buchananbacteria bacterium]